MSLYLGSQKVTPIIIKDLKSDGILSITDMDVKDVSLYKYARVEDSYLIPENIKNGVSILGVAGSYAGIIPEGTIYIENSNEYDVSKYASAKVNDPNLLSENIKAGISILGVNGSYTPSFKLQTVSITPSKQSQTVTASSGYDGLSSVTVNPISDNYIIPSGTINVTSNGDYDVSNYSNASISIPIPDGYVLPKDNLDITSNGTFDVSDYASAVVNVLPNLQSKTATPNSAVQTITAGTGYDGLSSVTVNPIPSEYIKPSGVLSITSNGTFNANKYASVDVNVPIPSGYIIPNGTKTITENGTSDVSQYAKATVNVQPDLEDKTVTPSTSKQIISASSGYDGLSSVTVNAIPSEYVKPSGTMNITSNGTYDVSSKKSAVINVEPNLQEMMINPSTSERKYSAESGYDGIGVITVNGVTSSIDDAIKPSNIKNGVSILGVTGTYGAEQYAYFDSALQSSGSAIRLLCNELGITLDIYSRNTDTTMSAAISNDSDGSNTITITADSSSNPISELHFYANAFRYSSSASHSNTNTNSRYVDGFTKPVIIETAQAYTSSGSKLYTHFDYGGDTGNPSSALINQNKTSSALTNAVIGSWGYGSCVYSVMDVTGGSATKLVMKVKIRK